MIQGAVGEKKVTCGASESGEADQLVETGARARVGVLGEAAVVHVRGEAKCSC